MGRSNEAQVKWLKELVSRGGGNTKLAALLDEPTSDADAGPVPDLINGEGVARADTKKPVGTGSPADIPYTDEQGKRDNRSDAKKPANTGFPAGIPDKDEQDKRDNRNDSGAPKTKMVDPRDLKKKLSKKATKQPPRAKALPLRIDLNTNGITAKGPEPRTPVNIQGEIPIESNANAKDIEAIINAIENEEVKVFIGGVPSSAKLLKVEGNYKADKSNSNPPPRPAIKVRIQTSIPPMPPGKDEIVDAPVVVQIGDISSDGKATIKVHYQPSPSKDPKTPAPTGFEALDVLNRPLVPKGTGK